MIPPNELVELERRDRPGREHHARSVFVIDEERFAVAATPHLDGLAAAHEVVVGRIEWVQHAHATLGVRAEHEQVAVRGQFDLDAGLVAWLEVIVVVERDFDRGIIPPGKGEREQQWKQHGAILYIPSPATESRTVPVSAR